MINPSKSCVPYKGNSVPYKLDCLPCFVCSRVHQHWQRYRYTLWVFLNTNEEACFLPEKKTADRFVFKINILSIVNKILTLILLSHAA